MIAKNAFDRISEMCAQLGLRNSIVEIGHQVRGASGTRALSGTATSGSLPASRCVLHCPTHPPTLPPCAGGRDPAHDAAAGRGALRLPGVHAGENRCGFVYSVGNFSAHNLPRLFRLAYALLHAWLPSQPTRSPSHAHAPLHPQVAIVAVAAHLSQHALGERFGLPALARRYRQDVDALEQVWRWAGCLCCQCTP